jgi:hypothetical protein
MLGIKLPKGIEKLDYEYLRAYLFLNSTGFNKLIKLIRDKYDFDSTSQEEIDKYLFLSNSIREHKQEHVSKIDPTTFESIAIVKTPIKSTNRMLAYYNLGKEVKKISQTFILNNRFVEKCIVYPPISKELNYYLSDALPVFFDPTKGSGFYIKVDDYTKQRTVIESWRYIKNQLRFFEETCDNPPKKSRVKIRYYKPCKEDVLTYMLIEKALKHNLSKRRDIKQIVKLSIESANEVLWRENILHSDYKTIRIAYIRFLEKFKVPQIHFFQKYK